MMVMMNLDLDKLAELVKAASPGPWHHTDTEFPTGYAVWTEDTEDRQEVGVFAHLPDAEIAALTPTLASRVLEQQKLIDGMRAEGCVAVGALERVFTIITRPGHVPEKSTPLAEAADIAANVLVTAPVCDHKTKVDDQQNEIEKLREALESVKVGVKLASQIIPGDTRSHWWRSQP